MDDSVQLFDLFFWCGHVQRQQWVYDVPASRVPYDIKHYVIRSFPLCPYNILHPTKSDLTRPPAMAIAKKQTNTARNKNGTLVVQPTRSDWHVVQGRRQQTATQPNIIYTRRFAPRAAYAARYACSGRKNSVKRIKKSPCLIVSANWRLENTKSPAAMLQENNPQTSHASVYLVCTWYLVFAMHIYVCLEASDYTELLSLGRRLGTDTDWVRWTISSSACCRWVEQTQQQ